MRWTTRLPWWFRRRTGIGLPPPHVLVVATMMWPWRGQLEEMIGRYIPRNQPIEHRGDFGAIRATVSGFVTFGDGSISSAIGVYDPRHIVDWRVPEVSEQSAKRHHVWCNQFNPHFPSYGVEGCAMCAGLRASYPEKGKSEEELIREHFPNIVKVEVR